MSVKKAVAAKKATKVASKPVKPAPKKVEVVKKVEVKTTPKPVTKGLVIPTKTQAPVIKKAAPTIKKVVTPMASKKIVLGKGDHKKSASVMDLAAIATRQHETNQDNSPPFEMDIVVKNKPKASSSSGQSSGDKIKFGDIAVGLVNNGGYTNNSITNLRTKS